MVKRAYDLYSRIYAFDNLVAAERAAARGKRGRPDVARFDYYVEDELVRLQAELAERAYRPGAYRRYLIHEPKERAISAAPYRDRVVHHAVCRVIEPLFERRFIDSSYASRRGKGTHAALDHCTRLARRFQYVLRCDIVQFFPAVDHAILRTRFARVIGDPDVLRLCAVILAGGAGELVDHYDYVRFVGDGEDARVRPRGLPIGNQTSQFWGNVYLDALDQFVKRDLRCPGYIRYVDDFVLFADDKKTLHGWKEAVIAFLRILRLTLHEAESVATPVASGIPFLGFRVYPDHRRLRRRNAIAFARRYRRLLMRYSSGDVSLERLTASVQGWVAHVAHGDTYGLRRSLLGRAIAPAPISLPNSAQSRSPVPLARPAKRSRYAGE
jgi:RNA-directed DNA polymerase